MTRYSIKAKKFIGVVLLVLFFVQMTSFLLTINVAGKLPDETDNITPNNPIPDYELDNIKVENDILFSCPISLSEHSIEIYNVSDYLNFQYYATYTLNSILDYSSAIVKYQIFDDKLFIVMQTVNDSSPLDSFRIAIEIVDISDVQNPVYISHMFLNETFRAEHPIVDIYSYRMFFSDDLLYISTIDYSYVYSWWSLRVLNCTDIYHPKEIARTYFGFESDRLLDYYLIDDVLYTFTVEEEVNKLTVFNYTDISDITIISKSDLLFQPNNFIGHYNDHLFVYANNEQCSFQIYENYTLGFVDNWFVPSNYIYSCINGQRMFSITSENFIIYNITDIGSIQQIGYFLRETDVDIASFMRLDLDKTRAFIAGTHQDEGAVLYIIDFSDPTNPVKLLPTEITAVSSIPFLSIVFVISIVFLLCMLKKRK
ncbi:MAG: hypothetical protein ACTSO7_06695 [Candidatus Heimdallarchaeota archaeon]